MGLVSGMVMGTIVGIAMMAGWSRMMRYRSTKRAAKVSIIFSESFFLLLTSTTVFLLVGICLISDQCKTYLPCSVLLLILGGIC
jgi:hypothetical protein